MTSKRKTKRRDYEVGKGRPPKASRWTKGQSGNPKGKARHPPSDAELIERLFRRPFVVIAGGEKVIKTGFALIHMQLLMKESAGHRRAGRTRDRYEAFARAHAGTSGVLLRFVDSEPVSNLSATVEPAHRVESPIENGSAPADLPAADNLTESES